jgi:hypothetical protein
MSTDLRARIAAHYEGIEESQDVISASEVMELLESVRPIPVGRPQPSKVPLRGIGVALGVAAVIVAFVAVPLFLFVSDVDDGPAADTPVTTAPVTPTEEEALVSTTAPEAGATTTTVAAVPIVPAGEGPKFSFVEAILPSDGALSGDGGRDWFGGGEWFDGSMFVPSVAGAPRSMFRSTDGLTWSSVPGFPSAGDVWDDTMLRADEDRIVSMVVPENDGSIRVDTSTNGDDWFSSTIDVPIFGESNGAGEFSWHDESNVSHSVLAVGPQGIVVVASMTLAIDGERFANSLVDPDADIHVEIIDLDLERSVMVVAFLDEENDMQQIGDLREIDLNSTGFGRDYAKILKAMAGDPDWEPAVDRVVSMFPDNGYATAVVHYAWFSSDGASWQRLPSTGPLDGVQFASVLATPTGFVATALNGVVWESDNGTAWTEAKGRGILNRPVVSVGVVDLGLVEWQGEVVEVHSFLSLSSEVWTLTDPPHRMFSAIPTSGLRLNVSDVGLIGTPTYGRMPSFGLEVLLSIDGRSWNLWRPSEFGQNGGDAATRIVGVGDDFVVIQVREWDASGESASDSLWVGRLP